MDIKFYVHQDYQEFINLNKSKYPSELIEGLRSNARVPGFVDNLVDQLVIVDKRLGLDRMKIKESTYAMTEFFLNLIQAKANQDIMSDLEKSRLMAQANDDELRQNYDVQESDHSESLKR